MHIESKEFTENLIGIWYLYITQKQFVKYTSENTICKKKISSINLYIFYG